MLMYPHGFELPPVWRVRLATSIYTMRKVAYQRERRHGKWKIGVSDMICVVFCKCIWNRGSFASIYLFASLKRTNHAWRVSCFVVLAITLTGCVPGIEIAYFRPNNLRRTRIDIDEDILDSGKKY